MKSFSFAALFFIASVFGSFFFRHDFELIIIALATLLGYLTGKVIHVQQDLNDLRNALARDWEERHASEKEVEQPVKEGPDSVEVVTAEAEQIREYPDEKLISAPEEESAPEEQAPAPGVLEAIHTQKAPLLNQADVETLTNKISSYVTNYFTGGNLFVRVGIIILFFGVSFLLKYISDRGLFPIEYRLMGVGLAAAFLLILGWRLRHKNLTYALLLQGAGVGMLYLDIYAAYSMYQLLSALPAFALLFVISMLSAALAVLQDSKSLAMLGFSGGFLAPVLASTGSNNHVALFSYYVVLNIALVTIAWFKAWRPLNLLGFVFTFVISSTWGFFSYSADKFASTEPFLILFFLFYVLIAVLFALRQPPKLRGYVDGSLLFGVPLAASVLQYSLVKDYEYGVSLSAFAMGAFYLLLAWLIWKRAGDGLRLLAEAFLALGVIFASMAIPFALAPTQTAAAWAVEGLGLLWLGSRQNRLLVRLFGLLLQFGAGFFVFLRQDDFTDAAFLNGTFISSMMMAVSGILSARLIDRNYTGKKTWENNLSPVLLIWGLLWLFGGFAHQIVIHYGERWLPANLLLLAAVCSLGFTLVAQRLKPEWKQAWYAASGLLAVMLLVALAQFVNPGLTSAYHPFQLNGWLAWPAAFAAVYYLLRQLELQQALVRYQAPFHIITMLLLVAVVTLEGSWYLDQHFAFESGWLDFWYALPVTAALWLMIKSDFWPFSGHLENDQQVTGIVLSGYLLLWGLLAAVSAGDAAPLPWIPVLNPLDITLGIVLITLVRWWQVVSSDLMPATDHGWRKLLSDKRLLAIGSAGLVFLWLNFTLFRIAHHWFAVAYRSHALYASGLVQSAVSIFWALSGVLLTIYASRKNIRALWIAGAVLLVLVVLKLFMIDLSELGNIARIVSFLVVGALLTSIGYFAPLPDKTENNEGRISEDTQSA